MSRITDLTFGGVQSCLMGRRKSLSLLGDPPRDGSSIKGGLSKTGIGRNQKKGWTGERGNDFNSPVEEIPGRDEDGEGVYLRDYRNCRGWQCRGDEIRRTFQKIFFGFSTGESEGGLGLKEGKALEDDERYFKKIMHCNK